MRLCEETQEKLKARELSQLHEHCWQRRVIEISVVTRRTFICVRHDFFTFLLGKLYRVNVAAIIKTFGCVH